MNSMIFLLPILVLDTLTFGDTKEENYIAMEMETVLGGFGTGDGFFHSRLPTDDEHTKAVNIVFDVLDVLEVSHSECLQSGRISC